MREAGRKFSRQSPSPIQLLLILASSIFAIELIIHFFLLYLPLLAEWVQTLLDSILLVALTFPALYYFVFRRLMVEVTERKQAEEEIRNTNIRLRTLSVATEQSPVTTMITDLAGNIIFVNPKFTEITGYSAEEVIGQNPRILKTDYKSNSEYMELWDTILSGQIWRGIFNNKKKNGELYWESATISPVKDEQGRITHFLANKEDITERRQAEQALRENQRFLAQLIENNGAIIFAKDREGRYLIVNKKWEEDLGIKREFAIGKKDEDLFPGTTSAVHRESDIRVMETKSIVETEEINQDMWGKRFYITVKFPLLDDNNIVQGLCGISTDITERKLSEKALRANALELERSNSQLEVSIKHANELAVRATQAEEIIRESEMRYRAVFDTANDAIISADGDGNIVDWNSGAERIFGYSKAEVCGQPLKQLLPARHQAGHVSGLERVKAGGEKHVIGRTVELEGLRKDGSELPLELSLAEWRAGDHLFFSAVVRDITERKRLKEELQQQASTDELTGIFNRRYFQHLVLGELKRANRLKRSLAVVLIDIDHFKHVNDTFGHAAGDQALLAFTRICRYNIREIDLFARFGGDEFALLLPEANFEQAYAVVDRIRKAVTTQPIDLDGKLVSITISSGITNLSETEETFDKLLSQADQALYRAKEAGRNKVVGYGQE